MTPALRARMKTFLYSGTEKKSGERCAELAQKFVETRGGFEKYVGAVVDNTSSMLVTLDLKLSTTTGRYEIEP